jgi:hypothetical protein
MTLIRSLGMSLQSLTKLMKCAGNDDVVTIRADDTSDLLALLFENKSKLSLYCYKIQSLMTINRTRSSSRIRNEINGYRSRAFRYSRYRL